ncbi:MAG: Loki-CTERM sorting domain-containing protein [Thermoplasmatota archaeon]
MQIKIPHSSHSIEIVRDEIETKSIPGFTSTLLLMTTIIAMVIYYKKKLRTIVSE